MNKNPMNPQLFGLKNSNRNFNAVDSWGKNQFNSSFPASLACYMHSKDIPLRYLKINPDYSIEKTVISVDEVFGMDPLGLDAYYAFETKFTPYEGIVRGRLPRADLVTMRLHDDTATPLRALEIKLTVIPDSVSGLIGPSAYGPEIVLRPDSILYLALSIASSFAEKRDVLGDLISPFARSVHDWSNPNEMQLNLETVAQTLRTILQSTHTDQKPFLIQPVWATEGQSFVLEERCFDVFVWSDYALTHLFLDRMHENGRGVGRIGRPARAAIWLLKMLYDFAVTGTIDEEVRHTIAFDSQTDKAFSASSRITRPLLGEEYIDNLRIGRDEIKQIILGGGERYLRPERRFDAAVFTSPALFESMQTEED